MKIVVTGGGIAGCVSAIGLKKLGYEVVLIHKERPFEAYEGFSLRTVEALQRSGCIHALKQIGPLSQRSSFWNASSRSANHEYLTFRPNFDRALIRDAVDAGVEIQKGSVIGSIINVSNGVQLLYKSETGEHSVHADAAVEARGRFTPYPNEYLTGPKSYSLLHKLSIPDSIAAKTSLHSVSDGWIWQASLGDGTGYIQMTCADETAMCIRTYEDLLELLHQQKTDIWVLENAFPVETLIRRDAYGKLHNKIIDKRIFRVGDSASSVDPLSGNGVFQSLSMSTILPFVIYTVLERNELDDGPASIFYKERVNDLFYRYSSTGRDFYRSEENFNSMFWVERRSWPIEEKKDFIVRIETKAILDVPFIEMQDVVITSKHPMGVKYFNNIDIVSIVRELLTIPVQERKRVFMEKFLEINLKTEKKLLHWLMLNKITLE